MPTERTQFGDRITWTFRYKKLDLHTKVSWTRGSWCVDVMSFGPRGGILGYAGLSVETLRQILSEVDEYELGGE